jgi:hypothetical protein
MTPLKPTIVTHVAGAFDPATNLQVCSRCGYILKDNREESTEAQATGRSPFAAGPPYPIGALVERGPGWQAMVLTKPWGEPCEEKPS